MFLVLHTGITIDDIVFLCFMQGGTVVLSGPGGPAVASVTPQTSELVVEVVHKSLISSSVICSRMPFFILQYYCMHLFFQVISCFLRFVFANAVILYLSHPVVTVKEFPLKALLCFALS